MTRGAVAIVLAVFVAGAALADHVYSHRYVIDGRLVGANGAPLPGRDVTLATQNVSFAEACHNEGHRSVTDEQGDFRFCFHTHALRADGRLRVSSGNASIEQAVDTTLRRSNFLLHDETQEGVAPPGWNESYRVGGRVWRAGPTQLEGVPVHGIAVVDVPVNLTIRAADGTTTRFESRTDGYGDFDLGITTAADPTSVTLTVEALGQGQPAALDAIAHRTSVALYVLPEDAVRAASEPTPTSSAPGSDTPRASPILFVTVAAALALSIGLARRKG